MGEAILDLLSEYPYTSLIAIAYFVVCCYALRNVFKFAKENPTGTPKSKL